MRAVFWLFKGLIGCLLLLISGLGVWLVMYAAGPLVKTHFRFDLSQSYRHVEEFDQILFYDRDSFYRRDYRGLAKVYTNPEWFLPYNGDMVWYGENGRKVYVWTSDMGIQCVDMEDYSVKEILTPEEVELTGAVHEISHLSQARYCKDWKNGAGFTYCLNDVIYGYDYQSKEICRIGTSQGDYGLTDQALFYLETTGEEQRLLQKDSNGKTEMIASDVTIFTPGPQCVNLLYYSRTDKRYHLYDTAARKDIVFPMDVHMYHPVISPDGASILYQEIESRSSVTDDEDCYYRVLDLVTYKVTTIYSGYREWLGYIW